MSEEFDLIVVGGGIAGTTLIESVSQLCPEISIGWFSPSFLFKRIKSVTKHGRFMESIEVEETECPQVLKDNPNIVCQRVTIGRIDPVNKTIYASDGKSDLRQVSKSSRDKLPSKVDGREDGGEDVREDGEKTEEKTEEKKRPGSTST